MMKHFDFSPTPITPLPYYSRKCGVNLFVKRDDLFPVAMGGSKARMLQYIMYEPICKKVKNIVTAGGPCSNFNRAIAIMCAQNQIKLKLVSYTDNQSEYQTSLNNYIVGLAGCEYVYCKKTEVANTILDVMNSLDKDSSYFIYGGGRSLAGIYAYYEAIKEIKNQINKIDELYVACGTGTTLSGICAGMQEFYPKAIVHGISVARTREIEYPVLQENLNLLNQYLCRKYDFSNLILHDNFLCGGYGLASEDIYSLIKECARNEGLFLDATYVGKAFYGMNSILSMKKRIGQNVLFWNTGGLINLLSQRDMFCK